MCGVAQEVAPEDGVKAYTNPWHVTVATGTVRAPLYSGVGERLLEHKHASVPAVSVLLRVHPEPELGADRCPLLRTSE